jgi:hypothetical protein
VACQTRLQANEQGGAALTRLTLELEGDALARGDVSAGLANVRECDGDLFPVGAGHAVREDMDVVSGLDEVERGLEDAHVCLDRRERETGGAGRRTSMPNRTTEVTCGRSRKRVLTSGTIMEKRVLAIVATCRSASAGKSISGAVGPRAVPR